MCVVLDTKGIKYIFINHRKQKPWEMKVQHDKIFNVHQSFQLQNTFICNIVFEIKQDSWLLETKRQQPLAQSQSPAPGLFFLI